MSNGNIDFMKQVMDLFTTPLLRDCTGRHYEVGVPSVEQQRGSESMSDNRYKDAAINLMGWATVIAEPAGEGCFYRVAGPRRSSKNVAESDIATMRKSIADYLQAVDDRISREKNADIYNLREALSGLLAIIHDDLTHARQRDHADAIGKARKALENTGP